MRTVFVFAYRGEAEAFLDRIPTRRKTFPLEVYESTQDKDDSDFLITGEGHYNASESMGIYLAMQGALVNKVVNVGVAGVVQSVEIERGTAIPIRTSYAYAVDHPEYESFSLGDPREKGLDCISSPQRVDTKLLSTKLGYIAPLVDRELWYIARICKKNNIPLRSYKSILDFPIVGEKISQKSIFSVLRDHSESLYLLQKKDEERELCKTAEKDGIEDENLMYLGYLGYLGEDFYSTFAQRKELEKLVKSYRMKFSKNPSDLVESVKKKELLPKERTQELLKRLFWSVDPEGQRSEEQWATAKKYYQQNGVSIGRQQKREPISYEFRFSASTNKEYESAVTFLKRTTFPAKSADKFEAV